MAIFRAVDNGLPIFRQTGAGIYIVSDAYGRVVNRIDTFEEENAGTWGGEQMTDLPDTVFMLDSVPHTWLFPRLSAVVHHGGAGTTGAGLRAGIPSIIVPFFGDQPFWGKRVAELGVGPLPIPRKKLTADRLAAAIQEAVSSEQMRLRAADLGRQIRAEDGISNAVELIKQI